MKPDAAQPRLLDALAAWREVLGADHVTTDPAALAAAERATFATSQRIPALISPGDRQQVQACLRIANTFRTPVYPISTGKNWGYGSRVPVRDGCVVLSLHRMNRIVEFDERLAYATIEPGVTFRQLAEHLRARGSRRVLAASGSTPLASVIGNTLERGIGSGRHGDRQRWVCGLEVVLPTGGCVHTGFARFPDARAAALHQAGVGPALDGLFTQSNLGVVTRMTVWLEAEPPICQRITFSLRDPGRLAGAVEALRELLLQETLSVRFDLFNHYRALSWLQQYPFEETEGDVPLPPAHVDGLLRQGGARWFGAGTLVSASAAQAQAERAVIESALQDRVERLVFKPPRADQDPAAPRGQEGAASAYWRKRHPAPADPDPDRDGCGVLWCSPVVPFEGEQIHEAVGLTEETILAHGFEPGIALRCLTPRSVYLVASILYDRDTPKEDERALRCHRALLARLGQAGYLPYRLGVQDMDALPASRDDHGALLQLLKRTLDPNDILAPGRYDGRHEWPGVGGAEE